jgi:puromycin-sensitive aminopeptidase
VTAATHRLGTEILPRHYAIELAPDLSAQTFIGRSRITATAREPVSQIVLNACDLEILEARLLDPGNRRMDLVPEVDPAAERLILALSAPLQPGRIELDFRFRGSMEHPLVGFYTHTVDDGSGPPVELALTHCSPTHARKLFPCWDEPAFKAPFGITVIVPEEMMVVSNGSVVSSRTIGDGRRAWKFAETIELPPHVLAIVAGDLEVSPVVHSDGVDIRFVTPRGGMALAEFPLRVAQFAVGYLSWFFGLRCPAAKLDLVAMPGFPRAGMENFGCVIFNDAMVAVDPRRATTRELEAVVGTIVHEISHMWFGNLVTMPWWDDVWLHEAFATFLEVKGTHAFRPDLGGWEAFRISCSEALELDALTSTRPLHYPVEAPADAGEMYDVLTYQKGAALIHMLERFVGERTFRDGVRAFVRDHARGHATAADLWASQAAASAQPVEEIMRRWCSQPGFPLVTVERSGDDLEVEQRRLLPGFEEEGGGWLVPLLVRPAAAPAQAARPHLLSGRRATLPRAARSPVILNAEAAGFYRVLYGRHLLADLSDGGLAGVSALERYSILDDLWAAVVHDLTSAATFLGFAESCVPAADAILWRRILGVLAEVESLLSDKAHLVLRRRWEELASEPLAALEQRGGEPAGGLGAVVLLGLGELGSPRAIRLARRLVASVEPESGEHPDAHVAALNVFAMHGGGPALDYVLDLYTRASTPQERRRYAVMLSRPRDQKVFESAMVIGLDTVSPEYVPFLLREGLRNRRQAATAWRLVVSTWDDLRRRLPANELVRIFEGVTSISDAYLARDVERFLAKRHIPLSGRVLQQYIEQMWRRVALSVRERDRLSAQIVGASRRP